MSKIHVAHILTAQKYEIDDVVRKLKEGKSFSELATLFSTCPSSKMGGDLGVVEESRLDADFLEAAQQLKPGEVSEVVKTRFGYHLIKKVK